MPGSVKPYDAGAVPVRRSLVLAGGGIRMSYQAGVLQALVESGITFQHIDGTSGGIFNTAMIASGLSPYEMAEKWKKLKTKNFVSTAPLNNYLKLNKMAAWGDADGIKNKVFPSLGIDIHKINHNSNIEATFNVCNFSLKTIEAIPHKEVTIDHLLAGVSLPIFMPALKIKDHWYSDAVWIKDANLMEAVKRGAEEIWLVWAIGNTREYLGGSFNQYVHMIEMSANGALLEEYEQIRLINCNILTGNAPYGQKHPVKLHVIKPPFPLPLDPDLFLKLTDAATLINMGYAHAKDYLKRLPPQGVPMDLRASQMSEPGISYSFRHEFFNKLMYNNVPCAIRYKLSFILRNLEGRHELHFFAGIYIEPFEMEIATYDNVAQIISKSRRMLSLSSKFIFSGDTYSINASTPLNSWIDWAIGLEFKTLKIEIAQISPQTQDPIISGSLYQSEVSRIRNIFRSKLDSYSHNGWKMKNKINMIKKIYSHEV